MSSAPKSLKWVPRRTGLNINKGCGATDLAALQQRVQAEGAAIGLALDGDGDRIMIIDADGQNHRR